MCVCVCEEGLLGWLTEWLGISSVAVCMLENGRTENIKLDVPEVPILSYVLEHSWRAPGLQSVLKD